MPSLKNPDWRNTIPKVVLGVIARDGLEGASIRRIAKELGFSTTVVTHTFPEKNELLRWSYQRFVESAARRYEAVVANDPADLVAYLMSMTAQDDEDLILWRAYMAIMDKVLSDESFADELRAWNRRGVARIEQFVKAYNPGCTNSQRVARQLLALACGISEQQILDPGSWTSDEIREVLTRQVECVLGPRDTVNSRPC
jgi:AcrR family transcriptional regulator